MPLASPSSLTSNTLATFLDHVPISTNNAEKWKPKQMGSNSSGDYWALSRALSAPLGTERWILHHLFLSTGTEVEGQKTVVAICLHVTKMPLTWGTLLWNATFLVFWIHYEVSYKCPLCEILMKYCYRSCRTCNMQTVLHTVAAMFCAADWHNWVTLLWGHAWKFGCDLSLRSKPQHIDCHLITHKPSRPKEYVWDAG